MFDKLGIKEEMKDKARKIPATPVGEIVAHGDAEIGFQQMSELSRSKASTSSDRCPTNCRRSRCFPPGSPPCPKNPTPARR